MELLDYLKEALHSRNQKKRIQAMLDASKKLSSLLPFPQVMVYFQRNPLVLKYLIISSNYFQGTLKELFQALEDRYYDEPIFLKLYFDSCDIILKDSESYSLDVNQNVPKLRRYILSNTSTLIKSFVNIFRNDMQICTKVNNFYKQFLKYTDEYELLNQCFMEALEIRNQWSQMKDLDPYFEQDVEEQLVAFTTLSMNNLDLQQSPTIPASYQKSLDKIPQSSRSLSKKGMKQQILEDWLFTPTEIPVLAPGQNATSDQLGSDTFKSKFALDAIISFILLPSKFEPQRKINNVDVDIPQPSGPTFRQFKVNFDTESRPQMQFRAFRAMQALTDNKNHFLVTQANKDYFIKTFSILYESLKTDLVAITICPEIVIQYLTFLLYQESDIATYFLLHYNIPFRLILFLDIQAVSQFLSQIMKFSVTPYHMYPKDQSELVWKYLEITDFFPDLMKMTMFDASVVSKIINEKSSESYKPEGFTLAKPELTPLQHEKICNSVEQKRIAEEMEITTQDLDGIVKIVQGKTLKAVKLFQRMIDNSNLQLQIQDRKLNKRLTMTSSKHANLQSPTRRRTVMAPKLAQYMDVQTPPLFRIKKAVEGIEPSPRSRNLFNILETTIGDVRHTPESPKPVFQRMLVKSPTKLIQIHTRSLSNNQRNSRLSSQINLTSVNLKTSTSTNSQTASMVVQRFSHLIGNISNMNTEIQLYPPELRDLQQEDLEKYTLDDVFETQCTINEQFTKGALSLVGEVMLSVTSKFLAEGNEIILLRKKWNIICKEEEQFFDIIRKNYLVKQKVSDDYDCSYMQAGRMYNQMLKRNMIINYTFNNLEQDLNLIIKILLNLLMQNKMKTRGIIMLESVMLIIEQSKQKYLLKIPVPFWHLLVEQFIQFNHNQLYVQYVNRILQLAFTYGSQIIYNRLILKVNCLSYLKQNPNQVKSIVLAIQSQLKNRSNELKLIQKQMGFISSWKLLVEFYSKNVMENTSKFYHLGSPRQFDIKKY